MQADLSHEQLLNGKVGEFRRRIQLLLTQQWVCVGLTWACVAGLLLVVATRLQWWTDAVDYLWAVLLIGAVAGAAVGLTRRVTPLVAAQVADERASLKERLSTAVELAAAPERSEVAAAQLADAALHARNLSAAEVLPWRAPAGLRWLAAAGAILLAAILLPELSLFKSAQERIDREVMRQEGERIQRVAKAMEKRASERKGDEKNDAILRRVAAEMKRLGKDQARNRISKKQALLRMNELQKQLKEAENASGLGAPKSLDAAAKELQASAERQAQKGNGEASNALKKMAENLQKRDFDAAKQQLEDMARKLQSGKLSSEEAGKAAETLREMAKAMEGSGLEKASQEMKDAAKELEKAAEAAQQLQQKLAGAKSDAERQQIQQEMARALEQGQQGAAQKCSQAGGT